MEHLVSSQQSIRRLVHLPCHGQRPSSHTLPEMTTGGRKVRPYPVLKQTVLMPSRYRPSIGITPMTERLPDDHQYKRAA